MIYNVQKLLSEFLTNDFNDRNDVNKPANLILWAFAIIAYITERIARFCSKPFFATLNLLSIRPESNYLNTKRNDLCEVH